MIFQKSSNNAIPYTLLAEDVTAQRRQPIAEGEQYVRDGAWTVILSFWPQAQQQPSMLTPGLVHFRFSSRPGLLLPFIALLLLQYC